MLAASLVPCGKIDKKRRRSSSVRSHAMAKQLPFSFICFLCGRKLTCPSMPIFSAVRKTDKAHHRRVSGPQDVLWTRHSPCPAYRRFLSLGLSSTVLIHAFVSVPRPGSFTLFGVAVRFQHVRFLFIYSFFFGGRKLTCPSMPNISAIRKTKPAIRPYPLCFSQCDQHCILHHSPFMTSSSLRFRIGQLGTDSLHPAFHTRWA